MQITVYTTTTCPYCKMLKEYLEQNNLSFSEKVIDQDEMARQEMEKGSGGYLGVTFTVVEKEGQKQNIIGFDKAKLNSILGI